ncbi:MAG: ABC transporter permease [Candidatus Aquicultorales bacterium]
MRLIRNILRRKVRSSLTIFGITIGVFALVVMGAMAEKINLLVDGGTKYYADKVVVADSTASSGFSMRPMSLNKIGEVKSVPGVADAFPEVIMMLDRDQTIIMGVPKIIISDNPGANQYEERKWRFRYVAGRKLLASDRGKCVVGADLVKDLDAEVGKNIVVRGKSFEVVGIMEKTLTVPDSAVYITLHDAQKLFYKGLPKTLQLTARQDELISQITVYPEPGVDPEDVAASINSRLKDIRATGPGDFQRQAGQALVIFNVIIFGVATISLMVGGLSVINTMLMSVSERTREIGIKKAIGASDWHIIRDFLEEAAAIGAIGGLLGLSSAWVFVQAANSLTESSGTVVFFVTGRLAVGAMVFAVGLGIGAGLYPAWNAARLNPIKALRYE